MSLGSIFIYASAMKIAQKETDDAIKDTNMTGKIDPLLIEIAETSQPALPYETEPV